MKYLNRKALLPVVLSLALVTGACSSAPSAASTTSANSSTTSSAASSAARTLAENAAVEPVADTSGQTQETITLSGTSASSSAAAVTVSGGTVTITAAGTYRISGTLTDGQLVVDVPGDGVVTLILDGTDITSSTGSALLVSDAQSVVVQLAEGTQNTLSDASTYAQASTDTDTDTPNAALYSTADLTI
ncbi:MAG TPA: carbohydrate-binding domain-containing protein, partial [Nakamurella multipartita]|nr:carbohydrate-binding domain-containing protein [Nakamurella multipartita]